ncbi:MAG TPA: macro domain-containing protein [Gemmataceae bacterium]
MRLYLVDDHPDLIEALRHAFAAFPEVSVTCGNILAVAENTLVSPANSRGYMDGGIDRRYLDFFGQRLQQTVQEAIQRRPEGLLPVGAALIVATGSPRIPYLIVAPTMTEPERIEADHCYRAMRAILRIAEQHAEIVEGVYCPGLGTGVGGVSFSDAARAMAEAYANWKVKRTGGGR